MIKSWYRCNIQCAGKFCCIGVHSCEPFSPIDDNHVAYFVFLGPTPYVRISIPERRSVAWSEQLSHIRVYKTHNGTQQLDETRFNQIHKSHEHKPLVSTSTTIHTCWKLFMCSSPMGQAQGRVSPRTKMPDQCKLTIRSTTSTTAYKALVHRRRRWRLLLVLFHVRVGTPVEGTSWNKGFWKRPGGQRVGHADNSVRTKVQSEADNVGICGLMKMPNVKPGQEKRKRACSAHENVKSGVGCPKCAMEIVFLMLNGNYARIECR